MFNITNQDNTTILVSDGFRDSYIPKFRLYMEVNEPFITIYWTDSEKGKAGILRRIVLDYADVMFGYLTPTSASEVELVINGYINSAWDDIINDLNNYVPYVGATQNVDLGIYGLTADTISFSLTPVGTPGTGEIAYDGQTGSLSYLFDNSNVECNIGQTIHANVHNAEGSPLVKGDVVYLSGSFGVCAENIATNQNGFVICQGRLDGLDTSMYADGDILYLGSSYGTTTNVKPYAPNHLVYVAVVEESSVGNGILYIRIQNGYELNEIHDVDLITTPPSTGDVLTYNGSLWVNQAPASGSGTVTSIATTSPITGGTITTSGTIGINQSSSIQDGYLSSADWSTFNSKQATLVSGTNIKTINSTSLLGSGNIAIVGLTDGDKGDITVSSSGTIWSIDARAVTFPKIQAMTSASRLLGRGDTLGSADIEEITLGSGIVMSGTTLDLQLKTINNTIVRGTGNISTPYTLSVQALTSSPVDAQTIYFGNLPKAPVTTANTSKVYIPRAGTIKRAEIYCYSGTAGTNQAWSGYIRLNNTTDTLISTLSVATNERVFTNSSLSIVVVAGDYIEIKFINPTWATNPLTTIFGGYIYIE